MILLIDNYDSFVHNLARYVLELGGDAVVLRNDEVTVDGVQAMAPSHIIISPGPCSPAEAGISTGKRRKCAVHCQALKSPARRRNCRVVIVRLILLARSQNQFGVRFRRWVLRIQYHFPRESCESHEFHAYYISPAGHARQPEFAFGVGRRSVLLPG